MTFVRSNTVNGNRYYWLVENYRDAGQVRQRRIAYLGRYPTVEAAICGLEAEIEAAEAVVKRMRSKAGAMVTLARRHAGLTVGELPRPDANHDPSPFRRWCRTHWQAKDGADKALKRANRLRERLASLRSEALKPPPAVVL